jgi:hypothetical protein
MYCESPIEHTYYGDVEHIRPKTKFPALEFVWENLGFVCARCNGAKRDKWSDATPYIDPYSEDPGAHLVGIGPFVRHRNGSERGELTWRDIDLNRKELVERRIERIDALIALIDKIKRTVDLQLAVLLEGELRREVGNDKPYAMVGRLVVEATL